MTYSRDQLSSAVEQMPFEGCDLQDKTIKNELIVQLIFQLNSTLGKCLEEEEPDCSSFIIKVCLVALFSQKQTALMFCLTSSIVVPKPSALFG